MEVAEKIKSNAYTHDRYLARIEKRKATPFYVNIRQLRIHHRYTQQQMADNLGLKRNLYQAWEEGRSRATYEALISISKMFKISIDKLLKQKLEIKSQEN